MAGFLIVLPLVLYGQLAQTDRQTRNLAAAALQRQGSLVAQALTPLLDHSWSLSTQDLNATLRRLSGRGIILKLMFRPRTGGGNEFYFIASSPGLPAGQGNAKLDALAHHGILWALRDTCTWDRPIEVSVQRADTAENILTSVIPIKNSLGCWVLVSADDGSARLSTVYGSPFWQTSGMKIAALLYLIFTMLAVLVVIRVRNALRHFHQVACGIRRGGVGTASFASREIAPELAATAADFDALVEDLHCAAANIRQSAEENAHAFKTPLATIRAAMCPLRRQMAHGDEKCRRNFEVIDTALTRLSTLVSIAQRMDNDTADFIEAVKLRVDLSRVVTAVLWNARDVSTERSIRFVHRLDHNSYVLAPDGVLDIIVENILDNAVSFSSPGGTITITLTKSTGAVDLMVEDEGPGIEDGKLDRVFGRNVSFRPPDERITSEPNHAGLGLWIVRRYSEALGGTVCATNRENGGLCIHVTLPRGDR